MSSCSRSSHRPTPEPTKKSRQSSIWCTLEDYAHGGLRTFHQKSIYIIQLTYLPHIVELWSRSTPKSVVSKSLWLALALLNPPVLARPPLLSCKHADNGPLRRGGCASRRRRSGLRSGCRSTPWLLRAVSSCYLPPPVIPQDGTHARGCWALMAGAGAFNVHSGSLLLNVRVDSVEDDVPTRRKRLVLRSGQA